MADSQIAHERKGEKDKVVRKPPFAALLTYTTDKNMCKGAIQYQDEFGMEKRESALFMNFNYFNNIRKYATEEGKEVDELKRIEREKDRENSKLMSQSWWDAPENLIRAKEEKKINKKKKYEEDSERILREIEIANHETDRKILADAKVMKFRTRQDIKEIQAACLLSEVLNEQSAQMNFNEKIKKLKEERERNDYENEKNTNEGFIQKEAEKAAAKRKANLQYGKELFEQFTLQNKLAHEAVQGEKERERQFFDGLPVVKDDSKQKKIEEFLKNLKNDELTLKFMREERQRDEEMEDKHIKDYQASVIKFNEAMKKRKEEKSIAAKVRAEVAVEKLNFFKADLFKREAKEKECMERDAKILAERQEQRVLNDERRRKRLTADYLSVIAKQKNEVEAKKKALALMRNFDRLREMKLDEDCKQDKDEAYQRGKEKQVMMRAILKEQMDSRTMREDKEREEMEKYREGLKIIQKKEDDEFLAYAQNLIEKSKSNERDVRPMEKLIKKFYERQKTEN